MPIPIVDAKPLGWLQIAIISLCWNREMYGLEIQKHLQLEGHKVGSGQLYPALKKLLQAGALLDRQEERIGATRNFYKTTPLGQKMVYDFVFQFLRIFNSIYMDNIGFVADKLLELISITPGMVVLDLSIEQVEELLLKLVPKVGDIGRYFLTSPSKDMEDLIKERILHYGLQDYIKIFDRSQNQINLPDHSCDLVFNIFSEHEPNHEWMLDEMIRLLKPEGKGVIIDTIALKDHIFIDMLATFIRQQEFGINPEKLRKQLNLQNMHILHDLQDHGVQYFVFERNH
jgi:DNA-binding PadR family transcriptional regulator